MNAYADPGQRARHLLVVDDDDRIRELLKAYLARAGFRVSAANGGQAARKLLGALDFDLAVFDVMMPGEDGLSLTRWLRDQRGASGRTPVLMLTARGEAGDRIEGLRVGADDYLAKPFEPEELLLRIEAILRRSSDRPAAAGPLSLGRCAFDPERGELTCDGELVRLTEAEVALMRELARTPHEPVDRMLLAKGASDPSGRAVDVQVTRLRRKIEDDPKAPRYLQDGARRGLSTGARLMFDVRRHRPMDRRLVPAADAEDAVRPLAADHRPCRWRSCRSPSPTSSSTPTGRP